MSNIKRINIIVEGFTLQFVTTYKLSKQDIDDLIFAINFTTLHSEEATTNMERIERLKLMKKILLKSCNERKERFFAKKNFPTVKYRYVIC